MRDCPNCGEPCISNTKLVLQVFVPGTVAACTKCYALIDFKKDDGLVSEIIAEWIFAALLLISFIYFGMLWAALAIFIVWRVLSLYLRVKGPLINVHPNS